MAYEMRISSCSSDVCSSDLMILGHWLGKLLARRGKAGRACARQFGIGRTRGVARHADMPELRHDLAADTVDLFHDALPTLQRLAMEIGHGGVHGRNRKIGRASCRARVSKYV